jgi:hypothetical protein
MLLVGAKVENNFDEANENGLLEEYFGAAKGLAPLPNEIWILVIEHMRAYEVGSRAVPLAVSGPRSSSTVGAKALHKKRV